MSRRASREGDRPIDFIERRVVIFRFSVEAGLLKFIDCNPVPLETGNHSHEALFNSRLASADSGLQLELGDRAKQCLSERPAVAAY